MLCWNLGNDPKNWASVLKTVACTKGDQLLEGSFHSILDKIEANMLQITENWNWNKSPNVKDILKETFQLRIPALHQSIHLRGWSLKLTI